MRRRIAIVPLILLFMACAHQETVPPPTTALSLEQTALQFVAAGDHLNASYFLEAALDAQTEDNVPVLKLLIEEQLLAGRLLAARASLLQLEQLGGADPAVRTLRWLVEQFIGLRVSKHSKKEGES